MIERSTKLLSLDGFRTPSPPLNAGKVNIVCPHDRQYVLRMLIKRPGYNWEIPEELMWAQPMIIQALLYQQRYFDTMGRFVYITVRHGEVNTRTDCVWHVDGFSMRNPHVPEQNYIWASNDPMETCLLPFDIPADFDPLKHNIHQYFQDAIPEDYVPIVVPEKTINVVDTYHIHRRPPHATGKARTMIRLSFVPIQIESDTCEQNPAYPVEVFNRSDIRSQLTRYPFQRMI